MCPAVQRRPSNDRSRDFLLCSTSSSASAIFQAVFRHYPGQTVCVVCPANELPYFARGERRFEDNGRRILPELVIVDLDPLENPVLEAITQLRADMGTTCVPVVVLLSPGQQYRAEDCYRAGVNSCILKHPDSAKTSERISALLQYWTRTNRSVERAMA